MTETLTEIDSDCNGQTGFGEPVELRLYALSTAGFTKHIVAVRRHYFDSYYDEKRYETWAFESDAEWNAVRNRGGHTHLFHFSSNQEVTWSDIEEDIRDNAYYIYPSYMH